MPLADSLILVALVADKFSYGKIHPVLFWSGLLIMGEHVFELLVFDSEPWRAIANAMFHVLSKVT